MATLSSIISFHSTVMAAASVRVATNRQRLSLAFCIKKILLFRRGNKKRYRDYTVPILE
ncbi:hypothetical protein RHECNPAF_3500084 [Rhizobium etli CNPAF512]|nr:hypothetical protein RHECNPAF_3500084 [Rhizobium etli CNPAF512]